MNLQSLIEKSRYITREIFDFARNLGREFIDKGCQKNAAALTYMTLFALVPLLTVTYSMFSVIPAFSGVGDQLQGVIFDNFVPETGEEVKGYLSDFSNQARNLTGIGVGMLVVTAYLMLTNIEKAFNGIWGVKQARKGLSSFLLYWAVLSLGPFLLGAGLLVSTYLLSLRLVVQEYDQLGVTPLLFQIIPLLMTTMAFTLLFAAVPNCRVPMRYALFGGFVTAICFELLKAGFGAAVSNSDFKLIYGAFAIVPLFLLWANLLWTIVLAGALFVRILSEHNYGNGNTRLSDIRAILQCLGMFRAKSQTGDIVSDQDCLNTGVNLVHWQTLRSLLVKNKWIAVTDNGAYSLCRDLQSVTVWDVACLVDMPINEAISTNKPIPDKTDAALDRDTESWLNDYFTRRENVEKYARETFEVTLEDLFTQKKHTQVK